MQIKTIKKPSGLVVGLDEVKAHLRLDTPHEDDLIIEYIKAATKHVENFLGKTLLTTTIQLKHRQVPGFDSIPLPYGPVQKVELVKSGVFSFNETTRFRLEDTQDVPELLLKEVAHEIEVVYVVGYGDFGNDVPDDIRQAIRTLTTHFYEARDVQRLPRDSIVWSLLHAYQVRRL